MTICLNMIVRNESQVIKRCFDSVLPFISYWVIVDTGSTDGTQELIQNYFKEKGVPGELHERPWIDFATDRNFALELGRGKADYLMFIDADECLFRRPDFEPLKLQADHYFIIAESGGRAFARMFLVKSTVACEWKGVIHEMLALEKTPTPNIYNGLALLSYPDGARSKNHKKFHNDVAALKKAYKNAPDNTRLLFYLARSAQHNKQLKAAITYYKKFIELEKGGEDVYLCYIDLADIYLLQKKPLKKVLQTYEAAAALCPDRMEPYYFITHLYRKEKNYQEAFLQAEKGILKTEGSARSFLERWVYQYGMHLEHMLVAYATGHPEKGRQSAETILKRKDISQNIRNLVERTLRMLEGGDLSPLETVK